MDYDPKIGRYIQADPRGVLLDFSDTQRQIANQVGIDIVDQRGYGLNHLYSYASQNPLIRIDPRGEVDFGEALDAGLLAGSISTIAGAAGGAVTGALVGGVGAVPGAAIGAIGGAVTGFIGGFLTSIFTQPTSAACQ